MRDQDLVVAICTAALSNDKDGVVHRVKQLVATQASRGHNDVAARFKNLLRDYGTDMKNLPEDIAKLIDRQPRHESKTPIRLSTVAAQSINSIIRQHKHADKLAAYGLKPEHKFLFFGPPGNGKTCTAAELAKSLDKPLYVANYATLISSHLGETASKIHKLFTGLAGQNCVLFLDEFDAIASSRGNDRDVGEINRVVCTLLTLLDSLSKSVVLIVSTNRDDALDPAIVRRFDRRVFFGPPSDVSSTEAFSYCRSVLSSLCNERSITDRVGPPPDSCVSYSDIERYALNELRKIIVGGGD